MRKIQNFLRQGGAVPLQPPNKGGGAGHDCLNLNFRQNFP